MKFMNMGPYPVELGFTVAEAEWQREVKKRGCPASTFPSTAGCVTRFKQDHGAALMIVTFADFKRLTPVERIGVVVHEATHIWQFIVEYLNEEAVGWEIEACAIQWITQWLLEQLQAVGWVRP